MTYKISEKSEKEGPIYKMEMQPIEGLGHSILSVDRATFQSCRVGDELELTFTVAAPKIQEAA